MTTFLNQTDNADKKITIEIDSKNLDVLFMKLIEAKVSFKVNADHQVVRTKDSKPFVPIIVNEKMTNENLNDFCQQIDTLIDDCIASSSILCSKTIAAHFNMTVVAFRNTFKHFYGDSTLYSYYINRKFLYACDLLKQGYKSTEISAMIGYGQKSSIKFNKMFQKRFGMTPKTYQLLNYGKIDRR